MSRNSQSADNRSRNKVHKFVDITSILIMRQTNGHAKGSMRRVTNVDPRRKSSSFRSIDIPGVLWVSHKNSRNIVVPGNHNRISRMVIQLLQRSDKTDEIIFNAAHRSALTIIVKGMIPWRNVSPRMCEFKRCLSPLNKWKPPSD